MVQIGRTSGGTWHVLGEYTCKHTDRATFDETKPLDEFEFTPPSKTGIVGVGTRMENGIRDAFCKRCSTTIQHWIDNRHRHLGARLNVQSPGDHSFSQEHPRETCDGCGKPESTQWHLDGALIRLCTTCRQALDDGMVTTSHAGRKITAALDDMLDRNDATSAPQEAPDWYRWKQRENTWENSPEGQAVATLTTIDGISTTRGRKLVEHGIGSIRELATADPATVGQIKGLGEKRARRLIENAHEHLK